jgi:uncharacterized RmlC-like cupin family protein
MSEIKANWRNNGIRIIKHDQLDHNVPSWPGMQLGAAITHTSSGANKIWAGSVTIPADAKTGAHHHGELESVIYVVSGKARMRWGEHLEFFAEAGPGDFIFVPPFVPHQEMNASPDDELVCILVRNNQDPVVVRLDIQEATKFEEVSWIDPHHPQE